MPDLADDLQGKVPPVLKWCFMGAGAAVGWHYASTAATPIPLSYIVGGAAVGFALLSLLFAGMRLVKIVGIAAACLLVLNYALLVPFGFGNHMPGWIATGRAALRLLDPTPLAQRWGKSVEVRTNGL